MRKTSVAILVAIVLGLGAAAATYAQEKTQAPLGMWPELGAALQEMDATQIGTLTVGDLARLAARLSVAEQKLRYVQRARMASTFMPGAGQFMTGNPLAGSLFVAGDLAVFAGTVLGAYFLLPTNVQFGVGGLDYFNTPLQTICNTWQGNTVLNYLPSFGVVLGGMIVQHILSHFAAADAARDARSNIASGKVTFTPTFDMMGADGRGFGIGMGMRMRY
jgi:hypothetical protein